MAGKIKILITSAGSTNGINVIKALKEQKEKSLFLVAADSNPMAAGFFLCDQHFLVPEADKPGFVKTIIDICQKEKIAIIIPTFSTEIYILAKNRKFLEKEGIKMAISTPEVFEISDNKLKTSEFLEEIGMPVPKICSLQEIQEKKVEFPVIVKPIIGSGSKQVSIAEDFKELVFFLNHIKNNFVQEFVEGIEYTIDGVSDLQGKVIAVSPRIRLEVKQGLATKSIAVKDSELEKSAKKIAEALVIIGPFNIQCIKGDNGLKFIEINCRFPSGGLPLTVKAGLNIPLIIVKMLLGEKIKKPIIKENIAMTRFWDSIIIEKISEYKFKKI